MAFITGSSVHYIDLLDDLGTYLVSQGWTENYDQGPPTNDWGGALTAGEQGYKSFEGPGVDSSQPVHIHVMTEDGPGLYGWRIYGSTAYSSGSAETPWTQPNAMGGASINFWGTSIGNRWFYVNDRRFIVIAKMDLAYNGAYAGFFMPFALPTEYIFPLYVAGTYHELAAYNESNNAHSCFHDPGEGGAQVRCYDGTVRDVVNRENGTNENERMNDERVFAWPRGAARNEDTPASADSSDYWGERGIQYMVLNEEGESPLFQCHLIDGVSGHVLGGLDGVYVLTGDQRSAETVVSNGSRDFKMFHNASRPANNGEFFAIEEV